MTNQNERKVICKEWYDKVSVIRNKADDTSISPQERQKYMNGFFAHLGTITLEEILSLDKEECRYFPLSWALDWNKVINFANHGMADRIRSLYELYEAT